MPLIIAHRGASHDQPEHTLAAFRQAIADGADALECDVRLTADGFLVCVHDRRIDRTSDGRGVVSTKTLSQLKQNNFASDNGSEGVLALSELLDLVVGTTDREVGLAIETKHPTRYAGLVEQRVVEMLRDYGLLGTRLAPSRRIHLMSFSEQAMRRWRDFAPSTPTVLLMDRVPLRCRSGWLPYASAAAGPDIQILHRHPAFVRRVHRSGGQVFAWTVDEMADVALCLALGVDAVITNRPSATRSQFGDLARA